MSTKFLARMLLENMKKPFKSSKFSHAALTYQNVPNIINSCSQILESLKD